MSGWFFVCVMGFFLSVILHFWSVEHRKLRERFGEERGIKAGKVLGVLSGWMELVFLLGFWVSPQPRFVLLSSPTLSFPLVEYSIPLVNLIVAVPLIAAGAWVAISAVMEMGGEVGFAVVDTHSEPERVVTSGPYDTVRHPQYLGASLAHVGGSILFMASYALLITPLYVLCIYLISWKEEKELIEEHGENYRNYQEENSMFIPKILKDD